MPTTTELACQIVQTRKATNLTPPSFPKNRFLSAAACQTLGNHEIDRDTSRTQPCPRLVHRGIQLETPASHRILDQRVVIEGARIKSEITVFSRFRNRDKSLLGVQVDRLCSYDNY